MFPQRRLLLNLGDGWNTDVGSSGAGARAKGTGAENVDNTQDQLCQKDEEGKVQKGNCSLSLTTSIGGALSNAVGEQVALVGTGVSSDTDSQCGCCRESENKVQEIQDQVSDRVENIQQQTENKVEEVSKSAEAKKEEVSKDLEAKETAAKEQAEVKKEDATKTAQETADKVNGVTEPKTEENKKPGFVKKWVAKFKKILA